MKTTKKLLVTILEISKYVITAVLAYLEGSEQIISNLF